MKGVSKSSKLTKKQISEIFDVSFSLYYNDEQPNFLEMYQTLENLGIDKNIYVDANEEVLFVQQQNQFLSNIVQGPKKNLEEIQLGQKEEREAALELKQQYLKKKGKI